ncbi:MAG TPA: hypothetical protein VK541_17440 [Pedobacter sp.]|uniref:hypothetical protein n=1 Tax=Pedobacter sp. TaxID=1411316 RepID=UPI002BF35F14|nr:hypothetical protein [Pedobacter sp.]HMI04276.1 hypothetical protein [Pedobacter sp.]
MDRLPYVNMIARITVGEIYFDDITSVEITESVTQLSDVATVTLPRFYKQLDGKFPLDFMKAGDKVKIEYGYEETGMQTEYEGYLRQISADTPLILQCDQLYPLRQNNFVKSYRSVSLRQLLLDVTKGTFIKKVECPDVALGKYIVDNASTFQVLDRIKEQFGFYARVSGDLLYCGFAWDWRPAFTSKHIYYVQGNVKKNDLTYKTKDEFSVRVRVKIRNKKGKEAYIEVGSKQKDATVHTIEYAADTEKVAKEIAEARLKKSVYDGYTGSITGFGLVLTRSGDSLAIIDDNESYREGTYLIEKVIKSYGSNGIERKNELAFKI